MIIFGQGAIRCHPYVLEEIAATRDADAQAASRRFDAALWGHVAVLASNAARSFWLSLTGARFAAVPGAEEIRPHLRRLTRLCAGFAVAADLAMLFLGGDLKRKEKISARLGDILSQLYLASCVIKRYHDEGGQQMDLPFVDWALQDCQQKIQEGFFGLFENFPVRPAAWLLRALVFPYGRTFRAPSDHLGHRVARLLMEPSFTRDRLTAGMFLFKHESDPVGRLDVALDMVASAEAVEAKIRAGLKAGSVKGLTAQEQARAALDAGVIDAQELDVLNGYDAVRRACIMVDDFPHDIGRGAAAAPANVVPFEDAVAVRKSA
jgi:acyl-CoA dehydrogenase